MSEQSMPSPDQEFENFSLEGIDEFVKKREYQAFQELGEQVTRIIGMGGSRLRRLYYFSDGMYRQAAVLPQDADRQNIIFNDEVRDGANATLDITHFVVRQSVRRIGVVHTKDTRTGPNWRVESGSGPHLIFLQAKQLRLISSPRYVGPALWASKDEMSERPRRTHTAFELAELLKTLSEGTYDENAEL